MPAAKSQLSLPQRALYRLGNAVARGGLAVLLALPYRLRVPVMGALASRVLAPLAGFNRRTRRNLALVCPDMPAPEVRRMCRAVADNAARATIEQLSPEPFVARAPGWTTSGPGWAAVKAAQNLLEGLDSGHLKPNGVVIIEAGELSPRSGLRKAFEKAKRAAALPCYSDGPADVRAMAQEAAAAEELRFDPDALDLVVAILGEDHGISRAEIDKLILYKGPSSARKGPASISLEDVRASLVDGRIPNANSYSFIGTRDQWSRALESFG